LYLVQPFTYSTKKVAQNPRHQKDNSYYDLGSSCITVLEDVVQQNSEFGSTFTFRVSLASFACLCLPLMYPSFCQNNCLKGLSVILVKNKVWRTKGMGRLLLLWYSHC